MNSILVTEPDGNNRTVEEQLGQVVLKLAEERSRTSMFNTMVSKSIPTNEVRGFVTKQMNMKRAKHGLDKGMIRTIMRSKLKDSCANLNRLGQQRDNLKTKLMRKYRDRRHRAKEIISTINEKGEKRRREWDSKHREKIRICRDKLLKVECVDMAPSSAKQYLDNVRVFKSNEVQPQMPAGPIICDCNIAISKDEYAFLVKGPQFMVRQKLNEDDFKVEIEKMITKHKYQTCNEDGEDTKSEEKKEVKRDEEDKRLEMLGEIEEARSRMTYNRRCKRNLSKLRNAFSR